MGCGSSKGDVIKSAAEKDDPAVKRTKVKPAQPGTNGTVTNGVAKGGGGDSKEEGTKHSLNSVSLSEASTIPASEAYQNGIDSSVPGPRPIGSLPPLKPPRTARMGFRTGAEPDEFEINQNQPSVPVAFEVPAEDGEQGSLIKRHPPRRLRKMVEDQTDEPPGLTHAVIEEKVQQANERRNQVLTQRVASARQKSARVRRPFLDTGGMNLNEFDGEIETGEKDESNAPDYLQ